MAGWMISPEGKARIKALIPVLMAENAEFTEEVARHRAEYIVGWGCCDKARPINCVCAFSTDCPEHGQRHNGSHD